jgi:hypothetical protein
MTDAEWLACTDPRAMLAFLGDRASDRRLRLFACGCCRAVWDRLTEFSRTAVGVAERYADGLAGGEELDTAGWTVENRLDLFPGEVPFDPGFWACGRRIGHDAGECARRCADTTAPGWEFVDADYDARRASRAAEAAVAQAVLARDIFGNPFRPVTADPSWLTITVVALARQVYETSDFSAMPILADALQDAGCDNAEVLGHLRGPGPHARGCWVIDLVLGYV